MELRQLQYLVAVADSGSFTAAADQQHVAQPALWKQVRALERELGVEVFTRAGRGVVLTATGATIVAAARRAVGSVEAVRGLATDLRTGRRGVVRIATFGPPVSVVLAGLLGRFSHEHPDVRVELLEMPSSAAGGVDPAATVLGGQADVGIGGAVPVACDSLVLYQTHVAVAAPSGHAWERRRTIDVGELEGRPLVVTVPGFMSRTHLDVACANAGFEPNIVMASPNPVSILSLVRAGLGVGVLSEDAAGPRPDGRPWARLRAGGAVLGAPLKLFWPGGRALSSAVSAWLDLAREAAEATEA